MIIRINRNFNQMLRFKKNKILCFVPGFICGLLVGYLICSFQQGKDFGNESVHPRFYKHYSRSTSDVFLIIVIFSKVDNFQRRETIRKTWLSDQNILKDVIWFFAISGNDVTDHHKILLKEEQSKNNDLLVFPNLKDSFHQLTTKLLASMGYLTGIQMLGDEGKTAENKTFGDFKFFLKCDDDSFVNVKAIIDELKMKFTVKESQTLYWGFFDGRAKPFNAGKYKEREWVICDRYIPYALGGGYVLAQSLVLYLAKNANFLKRYVNEDVSVGAWLSSYADLNRKHDPRFDTEYKSRGCKNSYLITHKKTENEMKLMSQRLRLNFSLCKSQVTFINGYIYNWTVPPSNCCQRSDGII